MTANINIYMFEDSSSNGLVPKLLKHFKIPKVLINIDEETALLKQHVFVVPRKYYKKFRPKSIIIDTPEGEIELQRLNFGCVDKKPESSMTTKERVWKVVDTQSNLFVLVTYSFANEDYPCYTAGIYAVDSMRIESLNFDWGTT